MNWDAETDLGKVTDGVLATRHGVSTVAVVSARKVRGIPACNPRATRVDWSTVDDLGRVPDRVIAERLGSSVSTVAQQRYRLSIPSFTESMKRGAIR